MKKIIVAINGLGRIGRAFYRLAATEPTLHVVAVNDLADKANMEYLLRHDSVSGPPPLRPPSEEGGRQKGGVLDGMKYLSEKDPSKLPWRELGVDVVVESTGFFASEEGAEQHIAAGAKRVVITAPIKDDTPPHSSPLKRGGGRTVLMGVNEEALANCSITSNASCTTNAAAPVIAILDAVIGVEKALLNTVHAYTATQSLVDSPAGKRGLREGRAAAVNIIPSSTGAAIAVTKAYPKLAGKFDGISLRVPVVCGSIADITFIAKRDTTAEEVNDILRKAAKEKRWQGIFSASDDDLVSSDIVGSTEGAIAELSMTRVVGGNLVKVLAWYDNESGYANTLIKHVLAVGKLIG